MLKRLKNIGPGAMVAAAFIGPGTVTTATIAGASYGYTLLWAILFSIIATYLLQEMSARLGVIGKMGVGEAIRNKISNPIFKLFAFALVVGAILIGNAAYEAGNITGAVLGFENYFDASSYPVNPLVIFLGVVAFALLFSGRYKLIERSLVIMVSVMGAVFILSAIMLKPNILSIVKGCFTPELPRGALIMVVGLIGTTVVPYNLFLHASSVKQRWSGPEDLKLSRWDTLISVGLGGLITMAILITAAVAFEGQDKVVSGASDLAEQLSPLLGSWSTLFIAFGFLAAGLSSAVTAPLAAGFATSELMGWKGGLKGRNFRMTWMGVLLAGMIFSSLGIRPTEVILFAQVANGLLLPVIAAFLLWIMNDRNIMGSYVNGRLTNILGVLVILVTLGLGLKGILSAMGML
ncbi:MAG: divalent metal cation transporter [Bacteroidetes bacterium]|nr:MAG: divalent metal cation transporter [Bacteroidota bacterium]